MTVSRVSAVGALAVAASDPRVIYVGTGQIEERYDMGTGSGVYRSRDGGQSWQAAGLEDTRHIGAVYVDPRDANVVLVAALGHLYGPNEQRGVYRSSDGGQSWSRTLYVGPDTGAVDIAGDPADPDHVYASTWQDRHWPWLSYFMPSLGPTSGIYESHDNGKTWARVRGQGPAGTGISAASGWRWRTPPPARACTPASRAKQGARPVSIRRWGW